MNKTIATRLGLLAATVTAGAIVASSTLPGVQAQKAGQSAKDTAKAARGTGADANIKTPRGKNDPKQEAVGPSTKTGSKTRGAVATYTVDNFTKYYIDIYVDGDFKGTVSPLGDSTGYADPGTYSLYGRAEFTDGSVKTWGPRTVTIRANGDFTWKLY
jgi:hypothetical protein